MRRILKNYGKWITAAVILAVGYCTVFGTGLPFNALDFSAEQVDSVEILDTWLSPAKVLIQEDIQFLIDSVNDSTRKGVSSLMRGGHPLTIRFHMKDGTTEELRVFSVDMYEGSPSVDLERGTGLIDRESGILEIESTLYLSCVELAYKYNPNGDNTESYEAWISRGYVPRLKENKGPSGPADLPFETPIEMTFASGVGAWATWITLNPDGTFEGGFHDSDMGDMAEDYPNGTMYYCNFSGSFEKVTRNDIFSYSMQLKDLCVEDVGKEGDAYIDDGVRYVLSTPYGMEDGGEFIFYIPETPVTILDEEFLSWWPGRFGFDDNTHFTLERYGLWNVNTGNGFFS